MSKRLRLSGVLKKLKAAAAIFFVQSGGVVDCNPYSMRVLKGYGDYYDEHQDK